MRAAVRALSSDLLRFCIGGVLFASALISEGCGAIPLSIVLYAVSLALTGLPVFVDAIRGLLRRDFLDEKFLMSVASVGAFVIDEYSEGVAVMLFYLLGEWLMHLAVRRSRGAVRSLMEICPDTAMVLVDGEEREIFADELSVGDTLVIRSGERVAADCTVVEGQAHLDTSMLSGEAMPRVVTVGDTLLSGSVVIGGALICRCDRIAGESTAARILELVESASDNKAPEESFIRRFARVYTPIVTLMAVLMAVLPSAIGVLAWNDALYRALSFLVVSCPCALVISVPMAFFGGIGYGARNGILFKGANRFSAISRAECVVFDKTGTLTEGVLALSSVNPNGISAEELIGLAAAAEYGSNHPIAECLKREAVIKYDASDALEYIGKGVCATVDGGRIYVGNESLMAELGISVPHIDTSTVYVSDGAVYLGSVSFKDKIRQNARGTIDALRRRGIKKSYILSGDKREAVEAVGAELSIDECRYGLLPQEKYDALRSIIDESRGSVIYVGDGINDAPSLAVADVGVAMGGIGSDSAIEAADVVIMSDDLARLDSAISTARRTVRIAKENIVFAIGAKLAVIALSAFNIGGMWLAVFADVGVALLAVLNSLRALLYRCDRPCGKKRNND